MRTTISTKGQIVLPELREADGTRVTPPPNHGLVESLRSCPEKRWFVLSEATKPDPDQRVLEWLQSNEPELAVDSIIVGELRFGILLLARGRRRARLERWFEEGVRRLHYIPWEASTGLRRAELLATLATALSHGLMIATLDRRDFEAAGATIVDPAAGT